MKNKKCPDKKFCFGYKDDACEGCAVGNEILKLHKRIDRLKKQNETLIIQRNAWALAAKAVKEDTVQKMKENLLKEFLYINGQVLGCIGASTVERVAKEMLEGE